MVLNLGVLLVWGLKWAGEEGGVVMLIRKGLRNPRDAVVLGRPSPECKPFYTNAV